MPSRYFLFFWNVQSDVYTMCGWNLRCLYRFCKLHKLPPRNLRLVFWGIGIIWMLGVLAWVLLRSASSDDLCELHEWFDLAFRGNQLRVEPMLPRYLFSDGLASLHLVRCR